MSEDSIYRLLHEESFAIELIYNKSDIDNNHFRIDLDIYPYYLQPKPILYVHQYVRIIIKRCPAMSKVAPEKLKNLSKLNNLSAKYTVVLDDGRKCLLSTIKDMSVAEMRKELKKNGGLTVETHNETTSYELTEGARYQPQCLVSPRTLKEPTLESQLKYMKK